MKENWEGKERKGKDEQKWERYSKQKCGYDNEIAIRKKERKKEWKRRERMKE